MNGERFPAYSGENPRGFSPDRPPRPPAAERSSPLVMEKFRAMLREREVELRAALGGFDDDEEDYSLVPPPTTVEIVQFYEEVLAELIFNSKLVITELTMIADEQRQHAKGIAGAICARILEVPVDQKLPSLYLVDSIVKNVGHEYVRQFAAHLPEVFIEAYNQVTSNLRPAMRNLFGTWSQYFPISVLCKIEDELHFSSTENKRPSGLADMRHSESPSSLPSPRPSHGIHVNPKYLETRHQLEHSAAMRVVDSHSDAHAIAFEAEPMESNYSDSPKGWSGASPKFHDYERERGASSNLQPFRHKPSMPYGGYYYKYNGIIHPLLEMARSYSCGTAPMRASSTSGGAEGPLLCSKGKGSRTSSPVRIGLRRSISPTGEKFQREISPGRFNERPSPPRSGRGLGHGGVIDQNGWLGKRWHLDDGGQVQQREGSIRYNLNNGHGKQHSRELIDTYGDYRVEDTYHEKHPKVQRLEMNSINNEAVTRKWKTSEEDEYFWEDMSPTLADRGRSSLDTFRPSATVGFGRPDDSLLDYDFKKNNWPGHALRPSVDHSALIIEDKIHDASSSQESMNRRYLDGTGSHNESILQYRSSHHVQESGKFSFSVPQSSYNSRSPKSRTIVRLPPYSASGVSQSIGQKLPGQYENFLEADIPFQSVCNNPSDSLNVDTPAMGKHVAQRPYSPRTPVIWPPVHKSRPPPLVPIAPSQKPFKSTLDFAEGNAPSLNHGPEHAVFLPQHQYDAAVRKNTNLSRPHQPPYHASSLVRANQQSQESEYAQVWTAEAHGNFLQTTPALFSSNLVTQSENLVQPQRYGGAMGTDNSGSLSGVISSARMRSMPDSYLHAHGGILPPLPPGSLPASSKMGLKSQNVNSIVSSSPVSAFQGLFGTLIAKGLISLAPPGQSQDSVGVEFNAELLKLRHESVINALYTDLSRQCMTCGLRFKCQEEHSNHMDWHVTKNRVSKNRKQKPSRKWFVSAKEWLSGAETLGTDVVPGFLPNETASEKKDEKEMAVLADENQKTCALCWEPFEYFYSDETEEWMYKGAVYLNAPNGYLEGLDLFQLGPIVHSKCRPESALDIEQP